MAPYHDHSTAQGTVSGTVLTVISRIDSHDYLKTAILAIVGCK